MPKVTILFEGDTSLAMKVGVEVEIFAAKKKPKSDLAFQCNDDVPPLTTQRVTMAMIKLIVADLAGGACCGKLDRGVEWQLGWVK